MPVMLQSLSHKHTKETGNILTHLQFMPSGRRMQGKIFREMAYITCWWTAAQNVFASLIPKASWLNIKCLWDADCHLCLQLLKTS